MFDYGTKNFREKLWSEVVVGDLVKIFKDEQFPCDLLFAKCSSKNGIAFVDTMNLDGEVFNFLYFYEFLTFLTFLLNF